MSRSRKKKETIPYVYVFVFFVLVIMAIGIPKLLSNTAAFLPLLLIFTAILMAIIYILVHKTDEHRRNKLRALQIADVDNMDGVAFERYLGNILETQGYHVRYTAKTGDFGVDILAKKEGVLYAIQAKRHSHPVGSRAVMEAHTGKSHYKAAISIVVTNNTFTLAARKLTLSTHTKLVDRDKLGEWILTFQETRDHKSDSRKISLS